MSSSTPNRAFWNTYSEAYQATHGPTLDEKPMAWGVWRIPESELSILGRVEGRRVLELGCGAAQWTIALARAGARAVGVDLSDRQLTHARARSPNASLVQGSAEGLPFQTGVFDTVFCDHGATVFAPAESTIAEASRVLRPDGLFAFCMSSPIRDICIDRASYAVTSRLVTSYFELSAFEEDGCVEYQLPYGAWIRLFRRHQFVVEDLVELQAPPHSTTTYSEFVPEEWARKWPAEHIWKIRKIA